MPENQDRLSSRARASAILRQINAEGAERNGDDNALWESAYTMLSSVNVRFSTSPLSAPMEGFEWDMHDLWHCYYHAAMNISNGSPNQDRLAFQVIQTREQGVITRGNSAMQEEAITSDGRIWTDLPFFVKDMTTYWVDFCASMTAAQRLNFAAFLAKLASIGIIDNRLGGIALIVLRDALETARPIGELSDQQNKDLNRQLKHLSIATLLPAVNAWLFTSGEKLIRLSETCWNNCPPSVGQPGDLLQSNATIEVSTSGFSPQRWVFWLLRLQEIANEARQASQETLANYAEGMMDNMLITIDNMNTTVKIALNDAGDMVQYQPTVHLLGPDRPV